MVDMYPGLHLERGDHVEDVSVAGVPTARELGLGVCRRVVDLGVRLKVCCPRSLATALDARNILDALSPIPPI
jgi:hypothetical protein